MGGGGTMRAGHQSILCKSSSSADSCVFGAVPSPFEIGRAIAALQGIMQGISTSDSGTNRMQLFGGCDPKTLLSSGLGRLMHAFHLLRTEPFIKRLVISLSSDPALWEAILNNDSVQKLHESLYTAENRRPRVSDKGVADEAAFADLVLDGLQWLIDIMKDKILDLVEKFKSLVIETFQKQSDHTETSGDLEEKLGSSLLLSVVIFLVVILARARGA